MLWLLYSAVWVSRVEVIFNFFVFSFFSFVVCLSVVVFVFGMDVDLQVGKVMMLLEGRRVAGQWVECLEEWQYEGFVKVVGVLGSLMRQAMRCSDMEMLREWEWDIYAVRESVRLHTPSSLMRVVSLAIRRYEDRLYEHGVAELSRLIGFRCKVIR